MAESALVALAGGTVGLVCANAASGLLLALRPAGLPRLDTISFDWTVLLFLGATVAVVAILVGIVPAVRGSRSTAAAAHADGKGAIGGPAHRRVRDVLVASRGGAVDRAVDRRGPCGAQFLEPAVGRPRLPDGPDPDGVDHAAESAYPDPARTSQFFVTLLDRLRAQPGITAAGAVTRLPLADGGGDLNFQIQGRETPPGTLSRRADWQVVTPGYFEAMGMRVVQGRGIEPADIAGSPGVIVFNESAARLHWPDGDALGARLTLGGRAGPGLVTVVGIVNDIRTGDLTVAPRPEMYLAHTQFRMFGRGTEPMRTLAITVRTSTDPAAVAGTLRQEVAALDPNLSVDAVRTMADVRAGIGVDAAFRVAAARHVCRRRAAGGPHRRLRRDRILRVAAAARDRRPHGAGRDGAQRDRAGAAAGLDAGRWRASVCGVVGGLLLGRTLRRQLYETSPSDPVTVAGTTALMAAAAFLACYVAARRAARIDPQAALRTRVKGATDETSGSKRVISGKERSMYIRTWTLGVAMFTLFLVTPASADFRLERRLALAPGGTFTLETYVGVGDRRRRFAVRGHASP